MRKAMLLAAGMLLAVVFCFAQTKTVSGTVTSAKNGQPVAGATVSAKKSNVAAISGTDGGFSITVKDGEKELVFSYVGYSDATVPIAGNTVSVKLTESASNLSEVVVVGYGTSTRKTLTGNVAVVKGSDVQNMPVPSLNQALQGRAAGVFVESQNGKVGQSVKLRIRGSGSITAGNQPLYVVDGLPINSGSITVNGTDVTTDPLADINFNDIESFNILKDAAATAIYGSRGANGVVLITTKKGKAGKTNIQVNLQGGLNKPTHLRGFLDAQQYVALLREAAINSDKLAGIDPTDTAQYDGSLLQEAEQTLDDISGYSNWREGKINTNWQKLAFNDHAKTSSIDVSASGGNEKTRFYVSGSYSNQDGILITNSFRRISGRMNIDHNISNNVKIGATLSLSQVNNNRVQDDDQFTTPMQIVALSPVTPVYDTATGEYYNSPVTTYDNPLVDAKYGHWKSQTYRNIGTTYLQWNIIPSLSFRTEFGVDIQNQNDDQFYGPQTSFGAGIGGYGESDWYKALDYNTNNYLTYNNTFGKHHINAVAGFAYQDTHTDYANLIGQDFPVQSLQTLASAGKITSGTSSAEDYRLVSYFARADYSFANKYLFGVSARIDGSSRFGANNKNGSFPALSAGWVMSEENWLKNSEVLSYLKVRASWGLTGNDQGFGNYASQTLWGGVKYAGTSGLAPIQLGNNNLQWEKSNQVDVGVEYGFLNNKISGEIDLYDRKTNHLLYSVPVPGNSGFITQLVNVGSMENKGVEFVLNTQNINSKNFKWTTSFNLAYNRNKVTKLDGDQTTIPGGGRFLNSLIVGQGLGVFYGPKFAGVDKQNGDALYYEEDGKTTTNDYNAAGKFVLGDPNPDWTGGITNTLSYKGIDLSFLFMGVFGNQIINGAGGYMTTSFDYYDNQTSDILNRWQKPGDVTNVPQLRLYGGNGTGASSRYIYTGNYVRLKNLTLSYSLPSTLMKKWGFQNLRVYLTGVNLLTWTKYPGWDPEVNTDYRASNRNQGGDFYSAPQIKNYSLGINLGF